jgi:hypothetical protein
MFQDEENATELPLNVGQFAGATITHGKFRAGKVGQKGWRLFH